MIKETLSFVATLLVVAILLFGIHYYILNQFFQGQLHFPLWTIYAFNAALVFVVYLVLNFSNRRGSDKMYQIFLGLTILKMALAIVFLLPLFFGKSSHTQLEVINFMIPYFLFLGFEIFSLNKFLQKS
jgi:drug/metabolite transporter (DMT)-like permease